ncbi:MAG: hypothetical protein PHP97_00865 [Candidatus Shapirobacteria bacterium]|nr:hypothetical protein [Candidatus Shapirobacteria bacterium]MDD3002736.1 hypothetical protein [Candidatus Shapirobacteria bacterium]MDD4383462.1 hypothetical protein [Candidatus Shapirobacteria bacterium]
MKLWTKILSIFFIFSLILLPKNTFAHPGNTASDGCHYCRTNCDRWGVPWNERHCHGGTVVETVQPTSTPIPTAIPTKKPTLTPTPTNTPTPIITNTPTLEPTKTEEISPTPQPEILGETTIKTTEPTKNSDVILGFSFLGLIGFGVYKLFVKIKNKLKEVFSKK